MDITGRPSTTDEQFQIWLEDLKPFLKLGNTLNHAIEKAELSKHRTTLYEKYRLRDWFSDKIDIYRSYLGEIVNDIFGREVLNIEEAQKQGRQVTEEQWRNLRFFAEKHRSSQPFFVNKQELTQFEPDKTQQIIDDLERESQAQQTRNDQEEMARWAREELEKREARMKSIETMSDEDLMKMQEKVEADSSMHTPL